MSAIADGQREQQLVRGVVTSVVAKANDSFQIEVREENAQYTRKLWTKDTDLVGKIHSQGMGQNFDFLCNVSHWTNQSGQQVRSLWIEEIAMYGSLQAPQQAAPSPGLPGMGGQQGGLPTQPQAMPVGHVPAPGPAYLPGVSMTPPVQGLPVQGQPPSAPLPPQQPDPQWQSVPPVVKEERILRQTAMKCACIMQGYIPEDQRGIQGLEQMAEWFVNYFKGGPQLQAAVQQWPETAAFQPTGQPQTAQSAAPPDWVTSPGPVPQAYDAGAEAQAVPGAYTGGFPS